MAGKDSMREKKTSLIFVTTKEKSEPKRDANERNPDCESRDPRSIRLRADAAEEAIKRMPETAICRNVFRCSSFSILRKILPARYDGGSGALRRMVVP